MADFATLSDVELQMLLGDTRDGAHMGKDINKTGTRSHL